MALRGASIRIIVHKPSTWDKGNLFGTIIHEREGNKLIVKLSTTLTGQSITSDLILLNSQGKSKTFKPLTQNYTVLADGKLINSETGASEEFMTGSITID